MSHKILTYEQIDRTAWTNLVETSATGTWFQLPDAYDFFASQPELFKPFVIAISNDALLSEALHSINSSLQTLRGVCVGYVTKEKSAIKQYFTRRAIIIGGPVLADDAKDEEVEALMGAVKDRLSCTHSLIHSFNHSPIYIETRNFNDYSRWKEAFGKAGYNYNPHLNFHVDCTDREKMRERMSENRKRQIRKGQVETGLTNEVVSEQDVREWYAILAELYKTKVRMPLWPAEFFIEASRQGIGRFMFARHEGVIIGGSMVVTDGKAVYEWFECGLNGQYKDQYPSVFATFAGMCYAAQHGIPRYDMMGAGVPGVPYGVRDFKAEFGGTLVEHGRFLYVAKPWLYIIGKWGVKMLKMRKKI